MKLFLLLQMCLILQLSPLVSSVYTFYVSPFLPFSLLPLQKKPTLCSASQCFLSFCLSRLTPPPHPRRPTPPGDVGMQVLSLLTLCGSLSYCMKMNFFLLLMDCPLQYIPLPPAIMSLIVRSGSTGLCTHPFNERSPPLPLQFELPLNKGMRVIGKPISPGTTINIYQWNGRGSIYSLHYEITHEWIYNLKQLFITGLWPSRVRRQFLII